MTGTLTGAVSDLLVLGVAGKVIETTQQRKTRKLKKIRKRKQKKLKKAKLTAFQLRELKL